jgi:hypothetical protein
MDSNVATGAEGALHALANGVDADPMAELLALYKAMREKLRADAKPLGLRFKAVPYTARALEPAVAPAVAQGTCSATATALPTATAATPARLAAAAQQCTKEGCGRARGCCRGEAQAPRKQLCDVHHFEAMRSNMVSGLASVVNRWEEMFITTAEAQAALQAHLPSINLVAHLAGFHVTLPLRK